MENSWEPEEGFHYRMNRKGRVPIRWGSLIKANANNKEMVTPGCAVGADTWTCPVCFIASASGNSGTAVVEWPAIPGQNIAVHPGLKRIEAAVIDLHGAFLHWQYE